MRVELLILLFAVATSHFEERSTLTTTLSHVLYFPIIIFQGYNSTFFSRSLSLLNCYLSSLRRSEHAAGGNRHRKGRAVFRVRRQFFDLFHDLHASNYLSERHVFSVQMGRRRESDEELRAIRVGPSGDRGYEIKDAIHWALFSSSGRFHRNISTINWTKR